MTHRQRSEIGGLTEEDISSLLAEGWIDSEDLNDPTDDPLLTPYVQDGFSAAITGVELDYRTGVTSMHSAEKIISRAEEKAREAADKFPERFAAYVQGLQKGAKTLEVTEGSPLYVIVEKLVELVNPSATNISVHNDHYARRGEGFIKNLARLS